MNIAAKNISKFFMQGDKRLDVLEGISVIFDQGRSYAITGVSGTGKSTLLHILAGIDEPSDGNVFFGDKDLATFSSKNKETILNRKIGLVFQSPYLISELSVLENVIVPGMIAGKSFSECEHEAMRLLNDLGIGEKYQSCPCELSGGQQQRVAIARAVFNKPRFLLADEPTGNLDIKTGKQIVDLLLQCRDRWRMGLIISSHDPYVAKSMDYKFVLESGELKKL